MSTVFDELANQVARVHEVMGPWSRSTEHGTSWLPLVRHTPLDHKVVARLVADFEVTLPDDYRQFLTTVGNGGFGPTYYPLFTLAFALVQSGPMDQRFELRGPVTAVEPVRLDQARRQLESFGAIGLEQLARVDEQYAQDVLHPMPGALYIGESGCGLDFFLVSDAGSPSFGQVWLSCDYGAAQVAPDFVSWYRVEAAYESERAARVLAAPANSFVPRSDVVVDRACTAIDRWVGLVQRLVERKHGITPADFEPAARDVVASVAGGPLLQWERRHASACFELGRELAGDDRRLLVARAWSEVLLGIGDANATLSPLGLASRPVADQLRELSDLERWTYADRDAYLDRAATATRMHR